MITEKDIQNFTTVAKCTKNLSDKTIAAYTSDLNLYRAFCESFGEEKVYDYVLFLMQNGKKSTTIKRHLSSVSQYYKYVYRNDKQSNPMNGLDFKLRSEKMLPKTLPLHDMRKLFNAIYSRRANSKSRFQEFESTRDLALLDLAASTGMRIGEVAGVKMEDLDLRSRMLLIHGKGRKERIIYISCPDTVENLREWIKLRKSMSVCHEYLFVNRNREPISIHAISDIFSKYKRLSKINPKATPHYLRHTFATNLLANGSDIRTVQEILGHSSVSVTERYTEVTPNRKIKVMKKYNYRNNLLK